MADKPLNEVTKVTNLNNVKTFLAVMNDNTIQQMSKEDLASVVGELIGLATLSKSGLLDARGFQPKSRIESTSQYSNNLGPGVYSIIGTEIIPNINQNGILLVFRGAYDQYIDIILHVYTTLWMDAIYYRFINGVTYENYTPWVKIAGTRTEITWPAT